MRALTLKQPFATAIAVGPKRIENRPRRTIPRAWALPVWIALHAGKTWWKVDQQNWMEMWPESPKPHEMPKGALLGVMRVDEILELTEPAWPPQSLSKLELEIRADPWTMGPWCLRIGEVRLLKEPIPCKGMLGMWEVPESIAKPLEALLPEPNVARKGVISDDRWAPNLDVRARK